MGNPWEIVRNDISYPIKFYGKLVTGSDGKRHWIGGEDIKAVAYDVPIPGYKTKTTINLRLWSTKVPSEDFDLSSFNSGEHIKACEEQLNAEKVGIHNYLIIVTALLTVKCYVSQKMLISHINFACFMVSENKRNDFGNVFYFSFYVVRFALSYTLEMNHWRVRPLD